MSTKRFLDVLFGGCDTGVVELRSLPVTRRTFTPVGVWPPLGPFITEEVRASQNVYVGVAVRRDASSGTTANLATLSAVWVDFDLPPADVRPRLTTFPFKCTMLVESGLGLHAYWKLREPLDLTDVTALGLAASLLRRLAGYLQGDLNATDPARILRVPGTFNYKYGEPRKVALVEETDAVVDVSELDDLLPREVVRHHERVLESVIQPGMRNDVLYSTVRSLRAKGLPQAAIVHIVERLNEEQCDPPLEQPELRRLLQHALLQRDRPDFTPPISTSTAGATVPAEASNGIFTDLQLVVAEQVDWCWPGWLPRKKGVALAGDPGMGKSMIAIDWTARVSAGTRWPTGEPISRGRVLLLCAEDGLADTVRPRVDAAGGDASQITVLEAVRQGETDRLVNLAADLAVLEYGLKHYRPSLVVIDPLTAYLGGIDSYKDSDVRGLLAPLLALADRHRCVLLWIAHLTKDSERKALYRAGASIAFVAAARVAMVVGDHPNEPDRRVVVQSKNNLAAKPPGWTYRVDSGAVVWGAPVQLRAEDVLNTRPVGAQDLEAIAAGRRQPEESFSMFRRRAWWFGCGCAEGYPLCCVLFFVFLWTPLVRPIPPPLAPPARGVRGWMQTVARQLTHFWVPGPVEHIPCPWHRWRVARRSAVPDVEVPEGVQ